MNQEISTAPAPSNAVTPPASAGSIALEDWAAELDHAFKIAQAVCTTKFAPQEVQGKPEEAAVRMLVGKSVGIDPLSSLSAFYEVHNRPAMYARTMVAVAQAQGHQIVRSEATEDQVVYKARRKGEAEWQQFTWTIARAEKAGYTSNQKYKQDPIAMLSAKASAEAVRTIAADALMGMAYSVEDIELEDLGEVKDAPKTTVKRTSSSKASSKARQSAGKKDAQQEAPDTGDTAAPGAGEDPAPEAAAGGEGQAPDGDEPIQQQTWDEIKSLLSEKAPEEKPGPWAMQATGRMVKAWKEFTQAEGDQMLTLLLTGETTADTEKGDA